MNKIQLLSIKVLNSNYKFIFNLLIAILIYVCFYLDSVAFCMKTSIPDTGESKVEIVRGINESKNVHVEEKISTPRAMPTIIGSQITEGESFDAYVQAIEEENLKLREENRNLQAENRRLMIDRFREAETGGRRPPRSPWGLLFAGVACIGAGCAVLYLLQGASVNVNDVALASAQRDARHYKDLAEIYERIATLKK